jgi:CheY-like chemotaxis protein/HPt (histidine-containing phosphotransfer) domain-containing protein
VASVVRFLVEDKYIAFILDLHEGIPECLYGDDIRLRQILLNLLGNAVKFTKEGYVKLSVETTDTGIYFTVSDTGMGIKDEDTAKLFWDFEQVDTVKNRDVGGTGLGLPIAKALTEMMGGRISMESIYGQGTSFHVEIPKVPGDKSMISNADDNVIRINAPEAKILVVDDNEMNLNVASGLLRLFRITAETAVSGRQAIEMIREKQYDIVFMDYMMPEMDGIEATRIIRGLGLNVIIIAFTANATTGARETMLEAGMDGYLSKPVIKKELAQILSQWLPAEKIIAAPSEAAGAAYVADSGSGSDGGGGADAAGEEGEEYREFWKKVDSIKGLSLKIGLDRVDGQRDVFIKTLRLMLKEIEKSSTNLPAFLANNDLPGFCIEVHGIKGALANIGVMEFAENARRLEFASRDSEVDFCTMHLPLLLEDLGSLGEGLREAFALISVKADQNGGLNKEPVEIPPEISAVLKSLMNACADFNIVQVDQEIEKLNKLDLRGALNEEIEQLKDTVLMMEYDEAAEHIRRLIANS